MAANYSVWDIWLSDKALECTSTYTETGVSFKSQCALRSTDCADFR